MLILDSCVLIAYFRREDQHFEESKKIINETSKIILNDYILGEIYTVLILRESLQIAQEALTWIVSNPKIEVQRLNEEELKEVVFFLQKTKTKLSFVDVSLLVMHKNEKGKLFSFDKDLMKNLV